MPEDAGVMEAPAEMPVESPVEEPGFEEGPSEIAPGETPEAPEPERPGREDTAGEIGSKEVSQALKSLRETSPAVADALRRAYFSHGQFTQSFPTAREAAAAKLAFDTIGGVEGIATLREQVQAGEWLEEAARDGDSSVIDDWAQDYPDGFKAVMPYAVKKWAQMSPEAFGEAVQPQVFGLLDRAQLSDRLSEAFDAIGNNNPQAAQTILRNIYQWYQANRENAQKIGQKSTDPQLNRLEEREQNVRDQEENMFRRGIAGETVKYQMDLVEKSLQPYLRGSKLSAQARQRLSWQVTSDVNQNLLADETYQRQVKAFLAKHDAQGAASYIKAHLDSIVGPISRRAYQDLYGPAPKAAKAATLAAANGRSSPSGPIRLNSKPKISDIQQNPGYIEAYITGQAIMATGPHKGKHVTWVK